jgi:hypothetical protein
MEYTYSFTKNDIKYLEKLHEFIKDIPELPKDFYLLNEDQVSVIFNEELNDSQIDILRISIENYTPPQIVYEVVGSNSINITNTNVNTTEYSIVGVDIWQGINNSIGYITIASNLIEKNVIGNLIGNGDYSVRIYDTINNNVIGEVTNLNNTTISIITIDNLSNIPTNDTLIEIQVKVSRKSDKCVIKACQFIYIKDN